MDIELKFVDDANIGDTDQILTDMDREELEIITDRDNNEYPYDL